MRRGFAAARAAMALVAAASILAGCVRRPVPPPLVVPSYPYSLESPRSFYATASGLAEAPDAISAGSSGDGELASRAPNATVLTSNGKVIVAAINGWGVERIVAGPAGGSYGLFARSFSSAFSGLTTGGAWPIGDGFLVQLFRDPFSDSGEAGTAADPRGSAAVLVPPSRLVFVDGEGGAAAMQSPFPRGLDSGFELFALLPAKDTWFAELRKDDADRVFLKFFSLEDPLSAPFAGLAAGTPAISEKRRSDFEAALKPQPLSGYVGDASYALSSALAALGKGPWIVRLRSASGYDRWYLSGGSADEAENAYAWIFSGAPGIVDSALAMDGEGQVAAAWGHGAVTVTALQAPVEGAAFTALAAADDIVAAAWEAGDFPFISSAGIVVAACPR